MARPRKKTGKRSRHILIRVTDEEHALICANAERLGLRISSYLRRVAADGEVKVDPHAGYGLVLAEQLRRAGNNLNQLMPLMHIRGEFSQQLPLILSEIEGLLDRISQAI